MTNRYPCRAGLGSRAGLVSRPLFPPATPAPPLSAHLVLSSPPLASSQTPWCRPRRRSPTKTFCLTSFSLKVSENVVEVELVSADLNFPSKHCSICWCSQNIFELKLLLLWNTLLSKWNCCDFEEKSASTDRQTTLLLLALSGWKPAISCSNAFYIGLYYKLNLSYDPYFTQCTNHCFCFLCLELAALSLHIATDLT